jgi:hypothetical protein
MVVRLFLRRWALSTLRALQRPAVVLLSALASVGLDVGLRFIGAGDEFWMMTPRTMAWVALLLSAWFWLTLVVSASTIAVLRAGPRWRPLTWVSAPLAFEAAVVTGALTVPILAGLVFLVVPGLCLALCWSQATFLILDRQASWFEAAGASRELASGRWLPIFVVWLLTGAVIAVAGWIGALLPVPMRVVIEIATDTFGLVGLAALFHELDTTSA